MSKQVLDWHSPPPPFPHSLIPRIGRISTQTQYRHNHRYYWHSMSLYDIIEYWHVFTVALYWKICSRCSRCRMRGCYEVTTNGFNWISRLQNVLCYVWRNNSQLCLVPQPSCTPANLRTSCWCRAFPLWHHTFIAWHHVFTCGVWRVRLILNFLMEQNSIVMHISCIFIDYSPLLKLLLESDILTFYLPFSII